MAQETVYIFGHEFSKAVFDIFVLLIGIFVGSSLTFFITLSSDNRKWRRDRQLREEEDRGKRINVALEWLLPVYFTLSAIEGKRDALKNCIISDVQFYRDCRNLIAKICRHELPTSAALYFPPDAFYKALELSRFYSNLVPGDRFNGDHKEYLEWVESEFTKEQFPQKVKALYEYLIAEHSKSLEIKKPQI